jgi:hypothetical protein
MIRRASLQVTIRSLRAAPALLAVLCFFAPGPALAQEGAAPSAPDEDVSVTAPQGAFPEASFEASFRKYGPHRNVYSPYYSWDAAMALDLTLFRKRAGAVDFGAVFQTAGTENLGSQVGVGGTGYILRAGYLRSLSRTVTMSAGVAHLSSHLTRDLDDKTDEQRRKGRTIPDVQDADEYNVVYLKAHLALEHWPLEPELDVVLEPVNFRFDFGRAPYARPLYLGTRLALWRGVRKTVAIETQHEVGNNAFNYFCLLLELFPQAGHHGRFHLFVAASPGRTMHVSPNVGALRDGVAAGLRLRFRS